MSKNSKIEKGLRKEYRAKIYLRIAKQPASFSELLNEGIVSRGALGKHLKKLEKEGFIYRDIIKPTETMNPSEIGKIIYKVKEDEMEKFLIETVMVSFTAIQDVFDNKELNEKIRFHTAELSKIIIDYVNQLRATREKEIQKQAKYIKTGKWK